MVLIGGEIQGDWIIIGLLENFTDIWRGHGKTFRVPAYQPVFIRISTSKNIFSIKFRSESGHIRKGKISKISRNAWVVSCNNRHVVRPCTIWPQIQEKPADLLFHLGDQIYADRVYWRWWRYLSGIPQDKWDHYIPDINRDYLREYYETWEPLSKILSNTSNIMIPDDHEIKVLAKTWDYLAGGISSEEVSWRSTTEIPTLVGCFLKNEPTQKEIREKFLLRVALNVCLNLYLGLRLTNTKDFDYFRVINGVSVILTQRITQPFLGSQFMKKFRKFMIKHRTTNILWMGGLPPTPIRPNFWELFVYRETSEVDDIYYQQFYDELFRRVGWLTDKSVHDESVHDGSVQSKIILIGGDLHVGCQGKIYRKDDSNKTHYLTFHVSSPSSGFPSAYIPQDSIDGTDQYSLKIDKYHASDPNAVWVNFQNFSSRHYFIPGSYADCWQNAASTGWTFWS